ncbi:MAG: formylglycine-generating enzyme family protein [Planctomycetes bacterium]|nr:formylglycine-generating enzyme family protein [Planctomycetota bacterium]
MQHILTTVFLLSGTLLLVDGCQRKPAAEAPQASSASSNPQSAIHNPQSADAMVLIQGGRFTMGDQDEPDAAPHEVTVSSFHMDKYLVTQEQYEKLMGDNPSRWKGPKNPVEGVRWSDAVKFCNARSKAEGLQPCYDLTTWQCNFEANGYRLPTEAEWEYACRAGTSTAYFCGNSPTQLGDYAWFDRNAGGRPQPVGQKKPNPWGLYDICGNVWHWCHDFYQVEYYAASPKENPRGPQEGDTRVVRGGAWKFSSDNCRSGYRYNENPGYVDVCFGYDIYGFRCVRNAPGSK